ncbi:DUF5406 family protein [Xanthobacter sp. DSM 24535]|uniref:DUF5406 family protein n=1 Tax=Roseixanthobacter psychrophilus TaxID=3119917 RepID=UPI00372A7C81
MGHIEKYSPNIRWGKQRVSITLMAWGYKIERTVSVGGNCCGFVVIEAAICTLSDELDGEVTLTNDAGDTLDCSDDDNRGEDWVKRMVVSASIIEWEPPTLNEVRAMNGAAPLPDGERAYDPG